MSAITDLVNLAEKLDKSIKDRKCLDMLFPLKQQILEVQKEQFSLEKQHYEEMAELKSVHGREKSDLKRYVSELEQQINELKQNPKKASFKTIG